MADLILLKNTNSPSRATDGGTQRQRGTADGSAFVADWLQALALEGRVYIAADADQNDVVLGQTSFANTTPTFLLNVPEGTTAIPLYVRLMQAGSVAGADITIFTEIDNIAAYASGGTAEAVLSSRTDDPIAEGCSLYTNATATAGYGILLDSEVLAADVDPTAEVVWNGHYIWKPDVPIFLVGPASLKVFTYAGTTGPSWQWSISWAEMPSASVKA